LQVGSFKSAKELIIIVRVANWDCQQRQKAYNYSAFCSLGASSAQKRLKFKMQASGPQVRTETSRQQGLASKEVRSYPNTHTPLNDFATQGDDITQQQEPSPARAP